MKKKLTKRQEKELNKLFASRGGSARARKVGKKGMSKLGKKGAIKRWGKKNEKNT